MGGHRTLPRTGGGRTDALESLQMRLLPLSAAVLSLVASQHAGCASFGLSERCRKQISDCLARCPPASGIKEGPPLPSGYSDDRSACEKACQGSCRD